MEAGACHSDIQVLGSGSKILVNGTLDASGTTGSPIRFRGEECPDVEGAWEGIEATSTATITLSQAHVTNAVTGVKLVNPASALITDCMFSKNASFDLTVDGGGTGPTNVTVTGCTFTVGGGSGIVFKKSTSGGTIQSNVIMCSPGSPMTTSGLIVADGTASTNAAVAISMNTISQCGGGDGIYMKLSGMTIVPTISQNTITACKYGIRSTGGGGLIGTSATDSDNILTGNTHAIYVLGGSPKIRNNQVSGNTYGVTKKSSGTPDLGTLVPNDPGKNNLFGNATYCIWNQTNAAINAVGNFFGLCDGNMDPPVCWSGLIWNEGHECFPPASASRRFGVEPVPTIAGPRILRIESNPLRGFHLEVVVENDIVRRDVNLALYDVTGRAVARRTIDVIEAGTRHVGWTLGDDDRAGLPSGMYFLRAEFGPENMDTFKFLVAR